MSKVKAYDTCALKSKAFILGLIHCGYTKETRRPAKVCAAKQETPDGWRQLHMKRTERLIQKSAQIPKIKERKP